MTLEKPEYKQMLLELMRASSFSGTVLPLAYELLLAIQSADIVEKRLSPAEGEL